MDLYNQRIKLIIPYYGSWPNYFDFFIESVNRNKIIDVLYVTDLDLPQNCNDSHSILNLNFQELKKLVKAKFPFYINFDSHRKLCDLKPLYGILFQEHIAEYNFWAFGDLDLMFGDLDNILPRLLNQHDVITFHDRWLSGPFTIFKNDERINRVYEKSKDLEKIFAEPKYLSFDECGYLYSQLTKNKSILDIERSIDCMFYLLSKESKENKLKFYKNHLIKESILLNDRIEYKNGKITFEGKELVHYHFITEKQYLRFKFPNIKSLDKDFYILHTGMYNFNMPQMLVKINFKYRIILNELYRFCGRLLYSISYRLFKKQPKLKYRINVFK